MERDLNVLKSTTARLLAGVLPCVLVIGGSVSAQPSEEDFASSIGALELPQSITLMGKADPNVRKATAIVNGEVITATDVDQRLALVILANSGKVSDEERERLRLQVLRNLIDETLQIQEARSKKIEISPDELNQHFARVAANFKYSPEGFAKYLASQGSSAASIKRQIQGELAWQRVLRREVQPYVNVSDDEVKAVIDRLKAAKGTDEYRISEIYLSAAPDKLEQVSARAQQIMDEIKKGGSFAAFARQYSEASTAAVGGDLGWVRPALLPAELVNIVNTMQIGQIAGPVQVPGGFDIMFLQDKRQVLTADPRNALLSLKQVSIEFSPGMTDAQKQQRANELNAASKELKGCGAVNDLAARLKADVVENDGIPARDLPPQLQTLVLALSIGESTPVFGLAQEGVRIFVLCGRDDQASDTQPKFEQIQSQIEDDRVNKRARTYLRDLRRDAVIDYN
ncbi:MAG: peptidylprolyl isomerase [Sphingobium sp.]|nr:peptidylprolyl isomerase [Sphingobium sp.]